MGLSYIDKIKGLKHVYKLVSHCIYYQLVLSKNVIKLIYMTHLFKVQLISMKFINN